MNRVYKCLISCISFIALFHANAEISVNVGAKPLASCKLGDIAPLAFDKISKRQDSISMTDVPIKCSKGATYKILADAGENDDELISSPTNGRKLRNGNTKLEYILHCKGNGNKASQWVQWRAKGKSNSRTQDNTIYGVGTGEVFNHNLKGIIYSSKTKALTRGHNLEFSDTINLEVELY